eukprot:TRINITY_DN9872_c0_g1_i2.p2 TRINITY_DN9872_c0_g1~~TRINITY_DN9872_c0_g1_i2.p2  ORF type:complete len:183 (-),score=82.09 TRINITY_DN9872_c0_g1_i2:172-720(-)
MLAELHENKDLIDNGNDENSSSGSEDCPSEDNLPAAVLKQILPTNKKANAKAKDALRSIFGFPKKKPEAKREKAKEEKKAAGRQEKKVARRPSTVKKEKKEERKSMEEAAKYVDASTQTERVDFQRARAKWVMCKFGRSHTLNKKLPCKFQLFLIDSVQQSKGMDNKMQEAAKRAYAMKKIL